MRHHIESLASDYPATRVMLGEERFATSARAFIEVHPSPYFNLRWYGSEFADFLSKDDPAAAAMATFEWAIAGAFDAQDADTVDVAHMASILPETWPSLRFEFHPSLRRVRIPESIPTIWKAATADEALPATTPMSPSSAWIVWRRELAVLYRREDGDETEALDTASNGANFAEVCDVLAARATDADAAMRAAILLRRWVEEGLITGLRAVPSRNRLG